MRLDITATHPTTHTDTHRLELRVLELEDTVTALTRIVGTMTEMLAGLNAIAGHYADHITGTLSALPERGRARLPLRPTATVPVVPTAGPQEPENPCSGPCGCAKGPSGHNAT